MLIAEIGGISRISLLIYTEDIHSRIQKANIQIKKMLRLETAHKNSPNYCAPKQTVSRDSHVLLMGAFALELQHFLCDKTKFQQTFQTASTNLKRTNKI